MGHEALLLSTDLLEYAPIPGLQNVARTLLQIWDALELVDVCVRFSDYHVQTLILLGR